MANNINNEIRDQFLVKIKQLCNELFKELVKEQQKKYEEEIFDVKTRNDIVPCIICKGSFTRHQKCKHDKSKKHQKKLNEIYQCIKDNY